MQSYKAIVALQLTMLRSSLFALLFVYIFYSRILTQYTSVWHEGYFRHFMK